MLSRIVILAFLLAIIWLLISAFYHLVREKGEGQRTVWRLTWRVVLSMLLFILLYLAFLQGWVQPSTPGPIGLMSPAQEQDGG